MADLGHWGGRGREKVVFEKKIRVVFFAIVFHFIFFLEIFIKHHSCSENFSFFCPADNT